MLHRYPIPFCRSELVHVGKHPAGWLIWVLAAASLLGSRGVQVARRNGTSPCTPYGSRAEGNRNASLVEGRSNRTSVEDNRDTQSTAATFDAEHHDLGHRNDSMFRQVPTDWTNQGLSRPRHKDDKRKEIASRTHYVIKSAGKFSAWEKYYTRHYHQDLQSLGIHISILRDVTNDDLKNHTGIAYGVEDIGDNVEIPVCEVSWNDAIKTFGPKLEAFTAQTTFPDIRGGYHNPYNMLWWKECAPTGLEYVWFVENDAFFNGNISNFLGMYLEEDADLISSGFRIAGHTWWQYDVVNKLGMPRVKRKTPTRTRPVVKNLDVLPSLGVPYTECMDGTAYAEEGLLFRQDHVDRWSRHMFEIIGNAMSIGLFGPGEVYATEVCLAWANLNAHTSCTMYDMAPLEQQKYGVAPTSPLYCWGQGWDEHVYANQIKFNMCTPQWLEKWIHPAKPEVMAMPGVAETPCLAYGRGLHKYFRLAA